jgi:GEVED domain
MNSQLVSFQSLLSRPIAQFTLGLLSTTCLLSMIVHPAIANQIPTSGATWTGAGTTAAATKDTPSGLRTTVSVSGSGMTMGSRNNASFQTTNTITVPSIPSTTNGMQVLVTANASCNNAALICNNLGTMTINFTDTAGNPILVKNPVLHMSRLGGALNYTSGGVTANYYLGGILTLTTPGAVLSSATGDRGFQVTGGNKIALDYTTFPATAAAGSAIGDCTAAPNAPQAGCGSIPVTGLVSSLSFNVDMNRNNTSGNWQSLVSGAWSADGIYFTVSFDEDFGDAPASYDLTSAASHIVSDLMLGSAIDVDNPTISNGAATGTTSITPSPNAVAAGTSNNGTTGDGADEDAITSFPALASNDTSYTLTVPISGASRAGQVCGWIDLNRNNVFDNATERACKTFVSGATTVTLNWTGLTGLTAGTNYVRLRASYDATSVQNPTGRLSSGEVEDYQIAITAPVSLSRPKSDESWRCSDGAGDYIGRQRS